MSLGGVIGGLGGALMGQAFAKKNDERQIKQNKLMMEQNIAGQKEIGKFNQAQAMQMWKDTGYGAQKEQMKEAGLNAGLMYKGAGAGGTTGGSAGAVSGGNAGSGEQMQGMALGLQGAMQIAQMKNVKANTESQELDNLDKREELGLDDSRMEQVGDGKPASLNSETGKFELTHEWKHKSFRQKQREQESRLREIGIEQGEAESKVSDLKGRLADLNMSITDDLEIRQIVLWMSENDIELKDLTVDKIKGYLSDLVGL